MDSVLSASGSIIDWITGAVGPVVLEYMQPLLKWFRQENVAPTLAASMAGIAIIILAGYRLLQIWPALATLNKPINFLRSLDRQQFSKRFDEFDAIMKNDNFLEHGWNEFVETFLVQETREHQAIEVTVRPSVFINLEDAEHAGLHLKWIGHLSGIFISLGLLLTFFGLVAALALASDAINQVVRSASAVGADAQSHQIQVALAELLKTASFKFWTSIAGLASGIIIGIYERRWLRLVSGKFDELNRELERVTMTVTPEMIASRTYVEIREQSGHLREFTGQFRFNMTQALEDALTRSMPGVMTTSVEQVLTNTMPMVMNTAVADALTERMPGVMEKAMAPLAEALHGMQSMNEDALRTMTGEFGSVVTQSAGQEIKAVAETLSALPSQIADAAGDMRSAALAMTEGMNRIVETVNRDVDRTRETLDSQLLSASQGLADAARAIKDSLEQVGRSMRTTTEEAGSAFAGEIAAAVKRIEVTTENNALAVELVVDRLKAVTNEIAGSLSAESATSMQAMKDAVEQMARSIEGVTRDLREGSGKSAEDITSKFLDAATSMQKAVNENTALMGEAVERIISAGNRAETGVGKAADDVGRMLERKGADAAEQVVEGSAKVLADFGATVERLWQRVGELSQVLATVEARIGDHVSALDGVTRSARATETAMAGSAKSLTDAALPLTRTGELLTQSMTSVVRSVETAAQGLTDTQRRASQLAADLRQAAQDMQTLWTRHVQRFDAVDAAVEGVFSKVIGGTDDYARLLADYVRKIDEHVANISGLLSGNVEELSGMVGELVTASKQFKEAAKALA
ncbi:MAG: hypothetical protein H7840_15980 [Alphaproteobacteria bacterium]